MIAYPPTSPYETGLAGKCPRCGRGALFRNYLALRETCDVCGLAFAKADPGDGPAVFAIFIVGFLAVVVAFIARFSWYFSVGAAFALSASVAIIAALLVLRPLKGILIALQYRHKAEEGRLEEEGR